MITEQEHQELKQNEGLKTATSELLRFFKELDLTPSLDIQTLRAEYKVVLFQKLLKVDKGLLMRYDMLRTEEAKLKLVDETINLQGYAELDELAEAIQIYEGALNSTCLYKLSLPKHILASTYGCDLVKATEQFVVRFEFDTSETYQKLKQVEDIINGLFEKELLPPVSHKNPYEVLKHLMPAGWESNRVAINEVNLYHFLNR